MLSLCLNTNHAHDAWFCSQDQKSIQPTYYPSGTCIECFLCLQDPKTLPTNFHQISVGMKLLTHNSDVSNMGGKKELVCALGSTSLIQFTSAHTVCVNSHYNIIPHRYILQLFQHRFSPGMIILLNEPD